MARERASPDVHVLANVCVHVCVNAWVCWRVYATSLNRIFRDWRRDVVRLKPVIRTYCEGYIREAETWIRDALADRPGTPEYPSTAVFLRVGVVMGASLQRQRQRVRHSGLISSIRVQKTATTLNSVK